MPVPQAVVSRNHRRPAHHQHASGVATLAAQLLFLLTSSFLLSSTSAQEILMTRALYQGLQEGGNFDALIDVRSEAEWMTGHIANATLMADLASANVVPPSSLLEGCQGCTVVVTCRSGHRAAAAIDRLLTEFNFTGTLYNGLGTSQWTMNGFPLVTTDSVATPCQDTCSSAGAGAVSQEDEAGAGLLDTTTTTTTAAPTSTPSPPRYSLTAKPVAPETSMPSRMPSYSMPPSTVEDGEDTNTTTTTTTPTGVPTVVPVPSPPRDQTVTSIEGSPESSDASRLPSSLSSWMTGGSFVLSSFFLLLVVGEV